MEDVSPYDGVEFIPPKSIEEAEGKCHDHLENVQVLRQWIKDERLRLRAGLVGGEPLDPSDPRSLVRAAFVLVKDWARQRAQVTDTEWAVINALERFVMRK